MQIISNLFYIILFTTVIGTAFTILSLLLSHVFHIALPLWFGVFGMTLYIFPILAPGLFLVSPEAQTWIEGYSVAGVIWACGTVLSALHHLLKALFAHRAAGSYQICKNERINAACARCTWMAGLKNVPIVCFGTLDDPACVMGVLHPAIILNEDVITRLTETQLMTVLLHEVTHIQRRHMIFSILYDCVCLLNWFNPFVWIGRKGFDVLCETDCDRKTVAALKDKISPKEYALTMLHLLELSAAQASISKNSFSALGFLLTKQRITLVLDRQSRLGSVLSAIVLILAATAVICFSIVISRGYFYPYPAYHTGIEYSGMK